MLEERSIPKVFISYSHDSKEHSEKVLSFSNLLRNKGVDCKIDQYVLAPTQGWLQWMREQIRWADFILIVCTKHYKDRFEGVIDRSKGLGRGSKREAEIIDQHLYDDCSENKKFLPIFMQEADRNYVPDSLEKYQSFCVSAYSDFICLYCLITNQPYIAEPPLGEIEPVAAVKPETFDFMQASVVAKKTLHDDLRSYMDFLEREYSAIQILGMSKPVSLEKLYVRVNILERIQKERFVELEELKQSYERKENRGFGETLETNDGLEVVRRNPKVIVLGKPGAGKTTFLKHVALHCLKEHLGERKIPIFIKLKEWSDSGKTLENFVVEQFDIAGVAEPEAFVERHLRDGSCLILLDGLDEVSYDVDDAIKEIRFFTKRYNKNRFVLSCRVAAFNTVFENFVNVEIADFDKKQIRDFIIKWFVDCEETAERCFSDIVDMPSIFELASNPLLLTLLCNVFRDREKFPKKRSELYAKTLEILIRRWNLEKGIQRPELFLSLRESHIVNLLSEIAYKTFERETYFIDRDALAVYVGEYLTRSFDWPKDALRENCRDLIQAIESQHGLWVERAQDVHSFSHLTFHEYLTALWLVEHPQELVSTLSRGVSERRWREVVLLAVETLVDAKPLLISMRREISNLVDAETVTLLQQLDECTVSENSNPYFVNKLLALSAVSDNEDISKFAIDFFEAYEKQAFDLHVEIDFSIHLSMPDDLTSLMNCLRSSELLFACLTTECSIFKEDKRWLQDTLSIEPWTERSTVPRIRTPKKEAFTVQKLETIVIDLPDLPLGATPLELVRIPKGKFKMGSPKNEKDRFNDEGPLHEVEIKDDFYMGKYPITQAQWEAVMGENPSEFKGNPNHPVEQVSWEDCQKFIQTLNEIGQGIFRLPSEAEWEYVCRARTKTRFYWGDDPEDRKIWNYAWFTKNTFDISTQAVGVKKPNPWGLFDMGGNVDEWCEDDWHGDYEGAPKDGSAWIDSPRGASRVVRGGSWINNPQFCRSAYRNLNTPGNRLNLLGFRVVQSRTP